MCCNFESGESNTKKRNQQQWKSRNQNKIKLYNVVEWNDINIDWKYQQNK